MKMRASPITTVLAALMLTLASAGVAFGQSASSIAVVDMDLIWNKASAAKSIRSQVDKELKAIQKWAKARRNKLQQEGQKYQQQRPALNAQQAAQREGQLNKMLADFQRQGQQRDRQIQQAHSVAERKMRQMLDTIVSDIAKKQKVGIVFRKSATIYSGVTKDLTNEALAALNKKLPSVKVAVKAAAKAPAKKNTSKAKKKKE